MNIKLIGVGLGIVIILLVGAFVFFNNVNNQQQTPTSVDYRDIEYMIDGQRVALKGGIAETEAASGSAAKIVTRYFGNELSTDLNNDGRDDVVFLLTQETGGSGTFYYVVAALATENGYKGSEAYLLGDRIAPQTTERSQNPTHQNVIVVNYADRAADEPMSVQPSVAKSVWLKLDPQTMQFGVVEQNFEGEADPAVMSLTMKEWMWVSALYNDGRTIMPNEPEQFVISFTDDGRFSATTDCNNMNGSYVVDGTSISFGPIAMTKKFCTDSQETEFLSLLEEVQLYHFTSRGELIFDLTADSGTATFK